MCTNDTPRFSEGERVIVGHPFPDGVVAVVRYLISYDLVNKHYIYGVVAQLLDGKNSYKDVVGCEMRRAPYEPPAEKEVAPKRRKKRRR